MNLVDSHAHLDSPQFKDDLPEVLDRAREAGVSKILTIGCLTRNAETERQILKIMEENPGIYAAFGVHPHDSEFYDNQLEKRLIRLLEHPKVIALGEIGLDYFYDNSPRDNQREVFRRQIELAENLDFPIIVHTRDAEIETLEILEDTASDKTRGILHCFSGTEDFASRCIKLGFWIGLGGMLTFKKASGLRKIAANLPGNRILIETDCPYLAPVPQRGKRNEPAYVGFVAKKLAEIRGMDILDLAKATESNFSSLFARARPLSSSDG